MDLSELTSLGAELSRHAAAGLLVGPLLVVVGLAAFGVLAAALSCGLAQARAPGDRSRLLGS